MEVFSHLLEPVDKSCAGAELEIASRWLTGQICACTGCPLVLTLMRLLPPLVIVMCTRALSLDCDSVVLSDREAQSLLPLEAPSAQRLLVISLGEVLSKIAGLKGRRAVVIVCGSGYSYVKTEFQPNLHEVLPGQLLQSLPSAAVDPGREVILTTFNCTVFAALGPLSEDGHPAWHSGLELSAVTSILEWRGLSWRVLVPPKGFGEAYSNGSLEKGGIKWVLAEALADIAICSIWVSTSLHSTSRPSASCRYRLCSRLLVPRPEALVPPWQAFLMALPMSFWWLHLLAAGVTAVVLHIHHLSSGSNSCGSRIGNSLYQTFVICFQGTSRNQSTRLGIRLLHLSWTVLVLLASNSFSSFLVAKLTTPLFPEPVESIEEMLLRGYKWTSSKGFLPPDNADAYFYIKGDTERKWFDTQVRSEDIVNGKTALYVQDLGENMFFISEPQLFTQDFLFSLVASKECLSYKLISILTRRLSSYSDLLSSGLVHLYESGIYSKISSDVLQSPNMKSYIVAGAGGDSIHQRGGTRLSLVTLRGAFYLLLGGLFLATGSFVIELCCHRQFAKF